MRQQNGLTVPGYSGKFEYRNESGAPLSQGACQVSFDEETCVITPAGGAPLAFDLGDVDSVTPAEWSITLTLFTGRRIELRQFGASFGRMSGELIAAWRNRTVQCLLLEDLEEVARYDCVANGTPAEIRLYGSNIAVLPASGLPLQWRLADIDYARFDGASYSMDLRSGDRSLTISKLARKTDEFREKLAAALDSIRMREAEILHQAFPFLNPDQLRKLVRAMPEGRSACLSTMAAIHPKLPDALVARSVDASLQPYFDALRSRAAADSLMAGFKFIRENEEPGGAEESEDANLIEDRIPLFFWYFFPIAGKNLVAWEATTGSGRATYFFKTGESLQKSVEELTRGLALINFRREPVYLPDDSLEQQPKFRRYAIGARKLPDLRMLRASFSGRAIHSSIEAWTAQADEHLGGT